MLLSEIKSKNSKTVNENTINNIIMHYHIAIGIDHEPTFKFINNSIEKYNNFSRDKYNERKKKKDNIKPVVPVPVPVVKP